MTTPRLSSESAERMDDETERIIEDYAARYRDFFWMHKAQELSPPNHHERQEAEDERHGAHKRLYAAKLDIRQRIRELVEEARKLGQDQILDHYVCTLAVGALNAARAVDGLEADPATVNWPKSSIPPASPLSPSIQGTPPELKKLLDELIQASKDVMKVPTVRDIDLRIARADRISQLYAAIESLFASLEGERDRLQGQSLEDLRRALDAQRERDEALAALSSLKEDALTAEEISVLGHIANRASYLGGLHYRTIRASMCCVASHLLGYPRWSKREMTATESDEIEQRIKAACDEMAAEGTDICRKLVTAFLDDDRIDLILALGELRALLGLDDVATKTRLAYECRKALESPDER